MEAEGLEQKVSWLDEQRRRDLTVFEAFQDRLAQLETQIESRTEQMNEMVAELSRLNILAARIEEFDDSLHKHRQEVSRQIKSQNEAREERERQLEELRKSDHESISTRLTQLSKEVQSLAKYDEVLDNRRKEEVRLSKAIDTLEKHLDDISSRTDDQQRTILTIEEAQISYGQRLSEAQTEVTGIRRQIESLKGSNDLVDDKLRRIENQLGELDISESEQTKTMEAWRENQARKLVDFERQWAEWEQWFANFEKMAAGLDERMIQYEETYRNTRQIQSDLEKVLERLERRINEITEMQRLSEDRQKQDWREFIADDAKRWNTYKLTMEEQWREHNRKHISVDEKLDLLSNFAETAERSLESFQENSEKRLRDLLDLARQWVQQNEASD